MKLILEHNADIEVIEEATASGEKKYSIGGIFAMAESKNKNGRVYPRAIMEKAVGKYVTDQVSKQRAVGELGHPSGPSINLDKVSHLITELKWDGDNVMGKASILNTPCGLIVKGLLDGGVRLGVSTRGMGSLVKKKDSMMVGEDFMLATVDIVQDPSAPDAFVNGIMEGCEWVWDNGVIKTKHIEKMETEIKKASRVDLYETQVREFKNFLSLLK